MDAVDVFVGLGSNLGDSDQILLKAWSSLGQQAGVELIKLSPPFLSAPVDMASNHWFTNAVGWLKTTRSAQAVLDLFLETEKLLGRERDGKLKGYQDRMIDLDLILYGGTIQDEPFLTLPHPRYAERLFVLAPMAAIAPEFIDPLNGRSVSEQLESLTEKIRNGETPNQEIKAGTWPESL